MIDQLREQLRDAARRNLAVESITVTSEDYHELVNAMMRQGMLVYGPHEESPNFGGIPIRVGEETKVATREGMTLNEALELMNRVEIRRMSDE